MPTTKRVGRTTLKDVARLAGVSVTTASVALSGKGEQERISAEVVRRVKEIARQRDYAPNLLVRSLQSGRTHVLTFYSSFRTHPRNDTYYSRLITALEQAAGEQGYNLLIYCRSQDTPAEIYETLNGGWCDGVIFFGPLQNDELLVSLRQSRVPTVVLNHEDPAGKLASVSDDWEEGIRQIARTIAGLGHRHVGAVTAPREPLNDAAQRIEAFRSEMEKLGCPVADANVLLLDRYDTETAIGLVERLQAGEVTPTALFCWHDLAGYLILDACRERAIAVPEQLSVVGYDGIHWATHSAKQLASAYVDLEVQAVEAVRILDQLIRGEPCVPIRQVYPVALRFGDTLTAPGRSI